MGYACYDSPQEAYVGQEGNPEEQSIRDQARAHIREAAELLKKAGIRENLESMASKEQDVVLNDFKLTDDGYDFEIFSCAVCGDDHQATFNVRRPKSSLQYSLEVRIETQYHDWSFWTRVKALYRAFKAYFIDKKDEHDFLVAKGDDLRRLKDVINRMN